MDDSNQAEFPTELAEGHAEGQGTRPSDSAGNRTDLGESATRNISQLDDLSFQVTQPPGDLFPEQMGRFRVIGQLGKGGFGTIYHAVDGELEREVAIKVANPDKRAPKFRRMYLQEARILAQLDHPGIVPVFDVGEWPDGSIYVISKFIPGAKLTESLRMRTGDFKFAAATLASVATAMAYAHSRRVVHRDLKPDNIMLDDRGLPIVVDFGLATGGNPTDVIHGRVGTRAYMSPEQARGESHRVDGRSDIYSLGVILYQFLTGKLPFAARSDAEQLRLFRDHEVIPPRQLQSRIPHELERICLKTLSQRASDRHGTAGDLAEELQAWLVGQKATAVSQATDTPDGTPHDDGSAKSRPHSGGSTGSRQRPLTDLVPRGLRSYGPEDSDFFLRMLPGPVGREGIPDSVWFWKLRIESRDAEQAFRVGLLFGESGSGKSSMVRAGILPVLRDVKTIVLESRPGDLADRLRKRLEQVADIGPLGDNLQAALVTVRDQMPEDRKLLIVLDQFEAYLHETDETTDWLAETLRQCDGVAVQALLVVREDFFRQASSFMKTIEEPLQQNSNFATIERFGKPHARRVLTGFGIALQAINPDAPDWAAEKFVEQAVDAMAEDGRVTPVRLAMLTEMLSNAAWTPATLRQVGGREGLEVAFLREQLTGAGAHPEFRRRPDLVRRILEALLPIESVSIRQHTVTAEEIIARGGMEENPEIVKDLLRLLDREVRLITPAGSDESGWQTGSAGALSRGSAPGKGNSSGSSSNRGGGGGPARYQLTHDHLVPSLRSWMAAEDEATWQGRNRLALRSAARRWSVDRGKGHLANPLALAKWQWLTRRRDWSEVEQEFLSASSKRLALVAAVAIGLATIVGLLVRSGLNERTRQGIVEAIRTSDLTGLPSLVRNAENLGALGHLRREAELAEAAGQVPTNFQWALLATDATQQHLPAVLEDAKGLRAEQTQAAAELVHRMPEQIRAGFLSNLDAGEARQRVAAIALAVQLEPTLGQRFSPRAKTLLSDLNALPLDELGGWLELLKPLQPALTPTAIDWLAQPDSSLRRDRVVDIVLALLPATESNKLATLASRLEPQEMMTLVEKVRKSRSPSNRENLVTALRESHRKLAKADEIGSESAAPLDARWQALITQGLGFADGECVAVSRLPRLQIDQLSVELQRHGYRLLSRRPSSALRAAENDGDLSYASAVWVRDGRLGKVFGPWSSQQLEQQAHQVAQAGWLLEDVAFEQANGVSNESGWIVIASQNANQSPDSSAAKSQSGPTNTLSRYADMFSYQRDGNARAKSGYSTQRLAYNRHGDHAAEVVAIWSPDNGANEDRDLGNDLRYFPVFNDWVPGATAMDARLVSAVDDSGRDLKLWAEYHASVAAADAQSPQKWTLGVAKWLRDARRWDLLSEIETETETDDREPSERAELEILKATALLYEGEIDAAKALYEPHQSSRFQDPFWAIRVASRSGDGDQVAKLLTATPKPKNPAPALFAKVMGLRADSAPQNDNNEPIAQQFLNLLQAQPKDRQAALILSAVREPALDRLLRQPLVRHWLDDAGWGLFCSGVWQGHTDRIGKLRTGKLADARQDMRTLRKAGYLPSCIETDGQRMVSAWQRPFSPDKESRRARALANIAVGVALLGEWDLVEASLREQMGVPVAEETLVALTESGADPQRLVELLRQSLSRELRRNVLCCLADFSLSQLKSSDQEFMQAKLADWALDQDNAVAAAVLHLTMRWFPDQRTPHAGSPSVAASDRGVRTRTIAPDNTTMIEIRPPEHIWIGSYNFEPDRTRSEKGASMTGLTRFAIGQTETTVAQFEQFLQAEKVQAFYANNPFDASKRFADHDDCPRTTTRFYDAIAYCQWLSEREGLPESEWCFPGIWDLEDAVTYRLPDDVLSRTGYRLPTEVEWELAASAASETTWPTGWTDRLNDRYAWTANNSDGKSHPIASKLPNRFGLFDMLGNASEWCLEPYSDYRLPHDSPELRWDSRFQRAAVLVKTASPGFSLNFNVRGGSYSQSNARARPSMRVLSKPDEKVHYFGFRIAKTLPETQ